MELNEVGSVLYVTISTIKDPHNFYVHLTKNKSQFDALNSFLNSIGDTTPSVNPEVLSERCEVVYKGTNGVWRRARVLSLDKSEEKCKICLYDYGITKQVPFHRLKTQPEHTLLNLPPLAVHCRLYQCEPLTESWSKDAINSMKLYCQTQPIKMTIRHIYPSGKLSVDLENDCNETISMMMLFCGSAQMLSKVTDITNHINETPVQKKYFNYTKYDKGHIFVGRLRCFISTKEFYVDENIDNSKLAIISEDMKFRWKQFKSIKTEDLRVGKTVCCLSQQSSEPFKRGIIKEIGLKSKVQHLDTGEIKPYGITFLKDLDVMYYEQAIMAICCCLVESQQYDNDVYRMMYPGQKLHILVIESGNAFEVPHKVQIFKY